MNQKELSVVTLVGVTTAITTNTNHTAVDIGATYADVGRREMKCFGAVAMVAGTTSVTIKIQDNTTSGATGFADITGATFTAATTEGQLTPIHFSTNKRYVRAVSTVAGTTISTQPVVFLLVEPRSA